MPKKPAIFLDRDGTLIEDVGVLSSPDSIRIFPDTVSALCRLKDKYELFVISNQPGIGSGLVTAEQVSAVNQRLSSMLSENAVHIKKWFVCPHNRKDQCRCIKPNPEFLHQAAGEYDLDLPRSFVIGDHPHDVMTGDSVGACGLYVLTGHGFRHLEELPPDRLVFYTIGDAAEWILKHPNAEKELNDNIIKGAEIIRQGGLVAFPTETVYGLGADALSPDAVARIFEVKRRPLHNPLIVHISDPNQVYPLVKSVDKTAWRLMEKFWPGPLTLVLQKSNLVPDIVTAGNPTVAIRMPANSWARKLITISGKPIAAPSANAFGMTSPTTARHVEDQLHGLYDYIIDGGACRVGIESTVLSLVGGTPVLLRPGGVSREEITVITREIQTIHNDQARYESPGMMASHYAPSTPLVLVDDIEAYGGNPEIGVICFQNPSSRFKSPTVILSRHGNLREAAANLYQAIRKLDDMGLSLLVAERAPNSGLGLAINDRLNKAATKLPTGDSAALIRSHGARS